MVIDLLYLGCGSAVSNDSHRKGRHIFGKTGINDELAGLNRMKGKPFATFYDYGVQTWCKRAPRRLSVRNCRMMIQPLPANHSENRLSLGVMDTQLLNKKFQYIGARLQVVKRPSRRRFGSTVGLLTLDIGQDRRGEFFEIRPRAGAYSEVEVLDIRLHSAQMLMFPELQ